MKTTIKLLGCLFAAASSLSAATLTGTSFDFSAAPAISGGILITQGAVTTSATPGQLTASFGYFTTGFNVANAVSTLSYATLFSNFNVLSSASVGSTTAAFGEDYSGLIDTGAAPFTPGAASIGNTIYGFYTAGAAFSAAGIGNGYALIQSPQTIIADPFPPKDYTMFPAGGTFVGGSVGSGITTGVFSAGALGISDQNAPAVNVVVVPEPSAALLGALGALGLLRRRRN